MAKQSNAAKAAAKAAAAAAKVEASKVEAPPVAPEAPPVAEPDPVPPVVDAAPVDETPKDEKPAAPKKGEAIALDKFIRKHEEASQEAGLVVTAISHPDAKERFHDGVYAGFPVTPGDLSATYSDGSKH